LAEELLITNLKSCSLCEKGQYFEKTSPNLTYESPMSSLEQGRGKKIGEKEKQEL